jgi:hypothetical protein
MGISNFEYQQFLANLARSRGLDPDAVPVTREKVLHQQIIDECARRQWICLHGSMAHRTFRTEGEWDFTILREGGRVLLIECKTRTGKLRPAQQAIAHWAAKLGHTVFVVRDFAGFMSLVEGGGMKTNLATGSNPVGHPTAASASEGSGAESAAGKPSPQKVLPPFAPSWDRCRVCACTEKRACWVGRDAQGRPIGCHWLEFPRPGRLCSACANWSRFEAF